MDQNVEPMDVDTSLADDSTTEFSRNDTNEISNNQPLVPESYCKSRGSFFTTGIDIFSKEEQVKMEERAKRFGLQENLNKPQIEEDSILYSSMGIADDSENAKHIRLNALHMRGTKDMSTKDVFKYFEDYGPSSIEWINDVSCNVVWVDNISAARALLKLSKKIVGLGDKVAVEKHLKSEASSFDDENKLANDDCIIEVVGDDGSTGGGCKNKIDDDNMISLVDIDCPLPPGLWRKGVDYPKSKVILLRFATRSDKKQPNAEKMSDYYKKYGNPNFGGIKGILTESRKRQYKQVRQSKKSDDNGFTDEENDRKRSKNPWGTLSETWGQNDSVENTFLQAELLTTEQKSSVKERLGFKSQAREAVVVTAVSPPVEVESYSDSDSKTSDEEWCKRSKVLRMRMHADDEEEKMLKKRIKQRTQEMYASMQSKSNDLRYRLRNPKGDSVHRDAIQVVVTNTSDRYGVSRSRSLTPEEQEEIVETVQEDEVEGEEELEEGEWIETSEQVDESIEKEEEKEESDDSDISEKEIQGPKGSVIKVVPRAKPRVASTVWARLNNTKRDTESQDRLSSKGDLRAILKGDLRSRLGYQKRGRSPLRIEVKNDKYAEESSDTD